MNVGKDVELEWTIRASEAEFDARMQSMEEALMRLNDREQEEMEQQEVKQQEEG